MTSISTDHGIQDVLRALLKLDKLGKVLECWHLHCTEPPAQTLLWSDACAYFLSFHQIHKLKFLNKIFH